ncbi:aminopeptidase [Spirochaeta isovalerica]|uniref:Aminopeptidase n=1 Tax=Spirochaeta isovalerica TaxID=150 RepID=A0A841R0X4_9SPIO|nr:aminopeptidase [Spirochaeta isovalerica]MBB6478604.1 aminopeptidase [Spirochaeta isovalerica]
MTDPRIKTLAENLVNYSLKLKKGEKILINVNGPDAEPLVNQVIKEVYKVGALPFVNVENNRLHRTLLMDASEELLKEMARFDRYRMKDMDAFLGIGSVENSTETSDVPGDKMGLYMDKYYRPVHFEERITNTRWTVMRFPTNSMAQQANTSLEAFEDFYFKVCNLDYAKMSRAMDGLSALMDRTDKVRITGVGTDLTFSIKDIPSVKCDGDRNIPDGEVYTAPVRNSVNGVLTYNTPAIYQGFTYENIVLTFKDGKIIKAEGNDTERINKVFDADEGARYIGEFAIGVNPYIIKPMKNTLFDEKIMGSFHFTPGNCYDEAPNGNSSSIHWDLVCIQTEEYGGGEIWFDDVLIRKNGRFVIPELEALNPENLK